MIAFEMIALGNFANYLEKLERETGLEPATLTLAT